MSESNEHRNMVHAIVESLCKRYQNIRVISDMQEHPGDSVPHIIDNYRPDVFAHRGKAILICEAKTMKDIESKRSIQQITTFIQYLEKRQGHFILGSYGQGADRAKTVLRFKSQELQIKKCQLEVFDGLDYWALKSKGRYSWHLI